MEPEKWALIEKSKVFAQVRFYVSSYGRLKSINTVTNEMLPCTAYVNEKGYLEISRAGKGSRPKVRIRIHQEVGKHFVDGWFEGAVLNHMDKNRANCRADNLEWVTPLENNIHGKLDYIGSAKGLTKEDHPISDYILKNSKPINCHKLNGEFVGSYYSISEAARVLEVPVKRIADVLRGFKYDAKRKITKSYHGYRFSYQ